MTQLLNVCFFYIFHSPTTFILTVAPRASLDLTEQRQSSEELTTKVMTEILMSAEAVLFFSQQPRMRNSAAEGKVGQPGGPALSCLGIRPCLCVG